MPAGCRPRTPRTIRGADRFVPAQLHVDDGLAVASAVIALQRIAGTADHAALPDTGLSRLDPFRVSRRLAVLDDLFAHRPGRTRVSAS